VSVLPREPFDAEEAQAARAYARLPANEPSPELDARIVARARGMVAAQRRSRPWFLGAGLGTAAAAVMAAGLAWQLGWLDGSPGGVGPAAQRAPAPRGAATEEVQRVEVEVLRRERTPPPLPEAASVPAAPPAPAPPPKPAARAAAAPPPPPPATPQEAPSDAAAPAPVLAAPQPFPAEQAEREDDHAGAAAAAPAGPARDGLESKRASKPDLESVTVTGTRLGRAAGLPPWAEDDALAPDAWLERIRARVHAGDRQGAEHSLRRFVLMHPRQDVPPELRRLLVE
jgi:hypothetical protein